MKKITHLCLFVFTFLIFFSADNSAESIHSHIQEKKNAVERLTNIIGNHAELNVAFSNSNIMDVIRFFTEEYGLNIITAPSVAGTVTFSFKGIHPAKAFDSLLTTHGLAWNFHDGIIHIESGFPYHVVRLDYARPLDIQQSLNKMITQKGLVSINELNSSIILNLPENELRRILKVIKTLDVPPLQVLVTAKILEVQADNNLNLGVDLSYGSGNSTGSTAGFSETAGTGLFAKIMSAELEAEFEALQAKSSIDILAQPKILAANNREASIITGERLGYKVRTTTGTTVSETIEFLEVGTKLTFTPHISTDGKILMKIKPEVSEGSIVDELPKENTTETVTEVLVSDGQTIIIGGLMRNKLVKTTAGIPILSELP
ncbi:MAG: type II secretory pathway component GspD/PulD (secretin), partial [Candidatus Marinamargulisbacteria bacterium]